MPEVDRCAVHFDEKELVHVRPYSLTERHNLFLSLLLFNEVFDVSVVLELCFLRFVSGLCIGLLLVEILLFESF